MLIFDIIIIIIIIIIVLYFRLVHWVEYTHNVRIHNMTARFTQHREIGRERERERERERKRERER